MAKKKEYYVVIHGRRPGLYDRWFGEKGAAEQVDGFADAVYRGLYTLQEAAEWLRQLHAETIAGLPPDLVDLLGLYAERPQREDPSSLLKAGGILIYTDGGAIDNPGPGGYGVVLRYKGHRKELSGGFRRTTNNRMELLACIEGLKALKRRCSVVLYSDSKYVVNGMTKGWAERWQSKGWKLSNEQDVKNADLWQQLIELCQQHDVHFRWVRGHSGNPDNERCDQLAMAAAQGRELATDMAYEAAR
ncbi:MAG: ribonuclease HI [Anaerolineae bacterium]